MKMRCFFIPLFYGLILSGFSGFAQIPKDSVLYYKHLALTPSQPQDLLDAFRFFERSKENHLQVNNPSGAVHDLRMLGIIFYDLGMYYESETAITNALELIEKNTLADSLKTGCYNQLGKIYRQLNNHERALDYYEEALELSLKTRDSFVVLNNMGNIYKEQQKWAEAEGFLKHAYSLSLQIKDSSNMARVLDNLSFVQYKSGDKEALQKLYEALQIRQQINDNKGIYSSYRHLALCFLEENKKEQAYFYAEQALKTAEMVNSPIFLKDALSLFSKFSPDVYFEKFKKISDSLETLNKKQENRFAAIKYDFNKEKQKTLEAELLQQKEKNRKQLFQLLFLLILLTAILFIYIIIQRQRKATLKKILQTENRISIKVHDEVANDLFHVMNKIQQGEDTSEILDDLENIYDKTRDISRENSLVEVSEDFQAQLEDLLLSYQSDSINIITRKNVLIPWKSVSEYKKIAVYKVLQELMTNMKKHSHATVVIVSFLLENKKIIIKYADNGVGNHIITKNGLQNAETRIRQAGGVFTFESEKEKGFKAEIEL